MIAAIAPLAVTAAQAIIQAIVAARGTQGVPPGLSTGLMTGAITLQQLLNELERAGETPPGLQDARGQLAAITGVMERDQKALEDAGAALKARIEGGQ